MEAFLAGFHIELNYIELLFRNCYDTGDSKTKSFATILHDVSSLARIKSINKKDIKYHKVMPLFYYSLSARLIAFVIHALVQRKLLTVEASEANTQ